MLVFPVLSRQHQVTLDTSRATESTFPFTFWASAPKFLRVLYQGSRAAFLLMWAPLLLLSATFPMRIPHKLVLRLFTAVFLLDVILNAAKSPLSVGPTVFLLLIFHSYCMAHASVHMSPAALANTVCCHTAASRGMRAVGSMVPSMPITISFSRE